MKLIAFIVFLAFQLGNTTQLMAKERTDSDPILDAKEQSIVTIAALTSKGDLERLKPALNAGLDAGLTINEIQEVILHLYAYAGFPRRSMGFRHSCPFWTNGKPKA